MVNWLKKNIFPIIIALVGVVYITRGIAEIIETGKTVEEIIANGFLATITGWLIATLYGELAIKDGMNSDNFFDTKEEYSKVVEEITNEIGKLHIFCDKKNQLAYERNQARILMKIGLSWNDFIKGNYDKANKEIRKAIKKARKSYREIYSFDSLLSGCDSEETGIAKRVSLSRYKSKTLSTKFLTSAIMGVVFGYFTLSLANGVNWSNIIWYALQIALFNLAGYLQYLINASFVEIDLRGQIIRDTNVLYEFKNSITKNIDWYKVGEVNE